MVEELSKRRGGGEIGYIKIPLSQCTPDKKSHSTHLMLPNSLQRLTAKLSYSIKYNPNENRNQESRVAEIET